MISCLLLIKQLGVKHNYAFNYEYNYDYDYIIIIMKLVDFIDSTRTDKNSVHSYIDLYQVLLQHKKETAKNVLEIGICGGGSIKMWASFFTNAKVHALDIIPMSDVWDEIKDKDNIILYTSADAYDEALFTARFISNDIKCDFILDDGPHSLESMHQFIKLYSQILTDDGILIIEDVQDWAWIDLLKETVPEHLKRFVKVYDLRANKNRYDDIVFTIDKTIGC